MFYVVLLLEFCYRTLALVHLLTIHLSYFRQDDELPLSLVSYAFGSLTQFSNYKRKYMLVSG